MHDWSATVTVTGVPLVTHDEMEQVAALAPGVVSHNKEKGELVLLWQFSNNSPDINDAWRKAADTWRQAVERIESAYDPVCTDFHVRQSEVDAEVEA